MEALFRMLRNGKVFMCVPTFREPLKTKLFLDSLGHVKYPSLEVIIINANGPDETSLIIEEHCQNDNYKLTEIIAKNEEFWSASVNRGLRYVEQKMSDNDWIIINNIDIEFTDDIVTALVNRATLLDNCQVGAMALSNDTAISSGVAVVSWALTLNKHPYAGWEKEKLPNNVVCPVDYLPGRCYIFPATYLKAAGFIDDKKLPHYGADYEFSYRLNKFGCSPVVDLGIIIHADMDNTGLSVYDKKTNITQRFFELWSIKNPANPFYRMVMVKKMYPFYYIPFGMFFYVLRSIIEVLFGNKVILKILSKNEHGFSGSNGTKKS
jgi:GT2 family glycosyltransferase